MSRPEHLAPPEIVSILNACSANVYRPLQLIIVFTVL